jgi:ATP-dependent DNA ligase
VQVALARARDEIPAPDAVAGGYAYDLKWDGFRLVVVRGRDRTRVWSRSGTDLTPRFPDVVAAAHAALPAGVVLDGEVVAWNGQRLDFDLLCRRLSTSPAAMAGEAAAHPASFVGFDLLALDFLDLRPRAWARRRAELEDLAAGWAPPLHLSPVTTDLAQARAWFTDYRPAGLEGLVAKPTRSRYVPGRTAWIKCKSRASHEVIVGAVIGPLRRPAALVLGRYRGDRLVIIGRTVPLSSAQAEDLGRVLAPPAGVHPWPERIRGNRFGPPGDLVALTHVAPLVVVEVSADAALHAGAFRHAVRYLRHRPDLAAHDLKAQGQ